MAEDQGNLLTVHYWQIANVIPPNHVRLAIFSYTVLTELAGDDDVATAVAMVDKELRMRCFSEEVGK